MPPRRNKEKFQQRTEFERVRIFLSRNKSSCAVEQFHSDASLEVVDRRAPNNLKNWQCTTEEESRFNLWGYDGCIRVRHYVVERCLPECIIELHSGLKPGVMVWCAISYHGRLRIKGNINSNRYVHEVLQPEVVPFLQGILGAIFQQENARPHIAKTVRDFCSAQHLQLLPWHVYSPDMSPLEHEWDLVGRRLLWRPAVSKDELLLRIQAIWNSFSQADIPNLFGALPRHIAALIVTCGGYSQY
ncbi:transposable element Tcb1 transposase [Trichonephila clavipes]|nr:transposable element Tcb1 transposase [Trichonephila clavipes]